MKEPEHTRSATGRGPKRTGKRSAFNEKLTAAEAKHLLLSEGGQMTGREAFIQIAWALAVSAALAWAILHGQATLWHLVVPLVAEYLCLLSAIPILYLVMRHPGLKEEFVKCSRAMILMLIVLAGTVIGRAIFLKQPWLEQLRQDADWFWSWIVDHQVHWALMLAVFHAARTLHKSVNNLLQHGPPFLGGGIGCAMKIVVLVFAVVLIPALGLFILGILEDAGVKSFPPQDWGPPQTWVAPVWIAWSLLLIADLATTWFLWDIQSKLKQEGHLPENEGPKS